VITSSGGGWVDPNQPHGTGTTPGVTWEFQQRGTRSAARYRATPWSTTSR
jgi:hypothetical protein